MPSQYEIINLNIWENIINKTSSEEFEISLNQIMALLRQRVLFIVSFTAVFCLSSIFYSLSIEKYYKSELLMISSLESGNQSSLISGLLGSSSKTATISSSKITTEEAVATLISRRFLENFIIEKDLLKILFPVYVNEEGTGWVEGLEEIPTLLDGYSFLSDSLKISFDSSLITAELILNDGKNVSLLLNSLVDEVNAFIRESTIVQTEKNIAFLQQEINKTQLSASKDMLYRLIEQQTQSIMLANTREDFAFRIIDPAVEPIHPYGPNRKLIVILGTIIGFFCSIFITFLFNFLSISRSS